LHYYYENIGSQHTKGSDDVAVEQATIYFCIPRNRFVYKVRFNY